MERTESALWPASRIEIAGRMFFSTGIMGIGAQHFIFANFIPVVVPWWPSFMPGPTTSAYVVGAILVMAGLLIMFQQTLRLAAIILGVLFFLSVLFLHIPQIMSDNPLSIGAWTNACKAFALCGSAFVVAGSKFSHTLNNNVKYSWVDNLAGKITPYGKYPLAIMVIVFGIDHFVYVDFVASLVPAWIPGHVFWTYFAGVALIAGGIGILFDIEARLAATLLGIMIFIWLLVLHIPRAIADPVSGMGNEWTSVFEALAFSGIGFILGQMLKTDS